MKNLEYPASIRFTNINSNPQTPAERMETPLLNTSAVHQLPESATCLSLSGDGQFLSVGHSRGLSLWSAASFICVAEWSQERIEIVSIQMTKLAEKTYLLGTIDDMGVARVLIYQSEVLHIVSVINPMGNINNRTICDSFQVSQDYGVALMCCNSAVWLEVFYFPTESWLKELGAALSHEQDSNSSIVSGIQWSPFVMINKINPLHVSESPSQVDSQYLALEGKGSAAGACTVYFLLPLPGEGKENTDLPSAVCLWWSGSKNLLQYPLQKATKNKSDFQSLPGVLWPNADEIVCSAVTGCTLYVALGLSNNLVCVWDRNFGSPLSVLSMSDVNSPFSGINFMDCSPGSPDDSHSCSDAKLRLLLKCKSGAVYTLITIGRGREFHMLQLTERVKDSSDLPTVAAAVPFLQDLALVITRNGKMYLQDVINKTKVCSLILPPKHVLASPCNPVFALNNRHHTLLIQGAKDTLSTEDNPNQRSIFCFGEWDIIKRYITTPSDSAKEHKTCRFDTLEDLCNQYLQERAKDIRQTWMQLQETTMKIKQRSPTKLF